MMKKFLVGFTVFFSYQSMAHMIPGTFKLKQQIKDNQPEGSCRRGVKITLDNASTLGRFAILYDIMTKGCHAVPGPEKFYQLKKVDDFGCNVKVYSGVRVTAFDRFILLVVDNRNNTCMRVPPERQLEVHERNSKGETVSYFGDFNL